MSPRLPAEWEPQSGLLLTWPHADTDWRNNLAGVENVFLEIVRHTAEQQAVIIACHNDEGAEHVKNLLRDLQLPAGGWHIYIAPSNDSWVRDHGPITVFDNNTPLLLDFEFNGWGGKHPAELDNRITQNLHRAGAFGNTTLQRCEFVLEGGSIETDGHGTLLVTSSCLLSPQRNGDLDKTEIETKLRELLGVERILWLNHGHLQGDDTDGHIDTLARFVDPETIVHVATDDPGNPHFRELKLMAAELAELQRADGPPYQLITLPVPQVRNRAGEPLPASYANFLLINHAVLVPLYRVPEDDEAMAILDDCFPDRSVIGINCRPLIEQRGSLHCVTMQLPAGVIP